MSEEKQRRIFSSKDNEYRNLDNTLRRRFGEPKPGVLAKYLLEVFFFKTETMRKECVEKRSLFKDGENFSTWRARMRLNGIFSWREEAFPQGTRIVYEAGTVLIPYINSLSNRSTQLATTDDIKTAKSEILELTRGELAEVAAQLRSELNEVLELVSRDYLKKNPPDTKERKLRLISNIKAGKLFLE